MPHRHLIVSASALRLGGIVHMMTGRRRGVHAEVQIAFATVYNILAPPNKVLQ